MTIPVRILATLFVLFLPVPSAIAVIYSETGNTVTPAWTMDPTRTAIGSTSMGLVEGDDIDALSLGDDPLPGESGEGQRADIFAVGAGAAGIGGELQTRAAAGEPVERDVYREGRLEANEVLIEELIPDGAVDAFDNGDLDPELNQWIYFSLATGSPTLAANGWSVGDLLMAQYNQPGTLARFAAAAEIGSPSDIDALSVRDATRDGSVFDDTADMVIYSLTPDDGQVHHYGAGAPSGNLAHDNADFGLAADDNIAALEHDFLVLPGDVDNSGTICLGDAIMSLQVLTQATTSTTPLPAAEISGDARIGLAEAAYVLQAVGETVSGPTAEVKAAMERAANASALAFSKSNDSIESLGVVTALSVIMGLTDAQQSAGESLAALVLGIANLEFPCGSITSQSGTLTFTFAGGEGCPASGTVSITPAITQDGFSYDMLYENVTTDDCLVNGSAAAVLALEGSHVSAGHTFESMSICGHELSGTVDVVYDITGHVVSAAKSSENTFTVDGVEVTVTTDVTYSYGQGFSGTAQISGIDEEDYSVEFEDITIDPACGLPNAGTLTVNGIVMDFTETTCENPVVEATYMGITVVLSLEDAVAILLGS